MDSFFFQQTVSFWENIATTLFSNSGTGAPKSEATTSQIESALTSPVTPPSASFFPAFPLDISFLVGVFEQWGAALLDHPETLKRENEKFLRAFFDIAEDVWANFEAPDLPFIFQPDQQDTRFREDLWRTLPSSRFALQWHLLVSAWLMQLLKVAQLDKVTQQQVTFWLKQGLDALSPSNSPALNPAILKNILESGGEPLTKGGRYWLQDCQKDPRDVFLSLTKPEGFCLGENLAITPGHVIFQNELMQLIHYRPRSSHIFEIPLLIIPPWINKFYLFDMRPENSFVRWALEQGHSVFMISWVNPKGSQLQEDFESYLLKGLMTALETVLSVTQAPRANLMGLCVGGNLLACALSYLKTHHQDKIQTATFLATLMDFHEIGDLGIFLGAPHFQALKSFITQRGFMDGHLMALTFSLLRANEMIWSPLMRRYFLGKSPPSLDFLFWNGDPLRIAGPLHLFFLETFFQKNTFKKEGGIQVGDSFCRWQDVTIPRFTLASHKDHIAPWKACFPLLWGQKDKFVLSTSGHIAGVINPPTSEKYGYWTGRQADTPESWFKDAQHHSGSWWPYWQQWITPFAGDLREAATLENTTFQPLEEAPGSYVKEL